MEFKTHFVSLSFIKIWILDHAAKIKRIWIMFTIEIKLIMRLIYSDCYAHSLLFEECGIGENAQVLGSDNSGLESWLCQLHVCEIGQCT